MIAIIDYGAGNIFSVKNALDYLNFENCLTKDSKVIENADGIILPGVGAFPKAMKMLSDTGLVPVIKSEAEKKPFLGICLGMQMLFDTSYEFEKTVGLGLIPGEVVKMQPEGDLSIPHIGWNSLAIQKDCPLTQGLSSEEYMYFVHSYHAICPEEYLSATCNYGGKVTALVFRGNIFGAQFHPEKSGAAGLQILKNFGGLL